ncbi:lipopolysaccharide biosynthesis protein [Curtobacterium sp. PhB115]|uniref:lipopolysaccharide biosynthesis protein n=1 Tax=Curtobacterium sp. PhB115 TaxID=2485173 RepID=UPI0016070DCA|nr:polysaccharide biosynthesis C-terminal domain-containing protein [Curtobacterium sp. PhB115]
MRFDYWWVTPSVMAATSISLTTQVRLRAAARSHVVALVQLADRSAVAIAAVVLICGGADPTVALALAVAIGPLVGGSLSSWLGRADFRDTQPGVRIRFPWRGSLHYGTFSVAGAIQGLDLPLLTAVGGASVGGVYGSVNRWTQPMGLLATAFSSAAVPFIAKERSQREAWKVARRSSWLLLLAVLVCLVMALVAPTITDFLLGSHYDGAGPVLALLALGTIPAVINQPCAAFLQARGFDRYVGRVTLLAAVAQLIAVGLLGHLFGAIGAGWAYLGLQIVNFILLAWGVYTKRKALEWRN